MGNGDPIPWSARIVGHTNNLHDRTRALEALLGRPDIPGAMV
jgi:hypothetical protein